MLLNRKKQIFRVFKIVVTCTSLVFAILVKSDINWNDLSANYLDMFRVKEILYDLSIGIFSSMLLVLCVDGISENLEKEELEREKRIVLKEQNRILQDHIERYFKYYYYVITPRKERKESIDSIPSSISLQDMQDLHRPVAELGMKSPVEVFLEAEQTLKSLFSYYLLNGSINPTVSTYLTDYINESSKLECRAAILAVEKQFEDSEYIIEFISKQLAQRTAEEVYEKSKLGQEKSNILYPYVQLREMMEKERELLLQYQKAITG